MLFLSRPLTAVGVAAPFALVAAVGLVWDRRRASAYVMMLLCFLPFLAAFLAYNELTTGDPWRSAYELYWPYDRIGFGHGIGSNGYHGYAEAILNTRINLESLSQYVFGWPAGLSLWPVTVVALVVLLRLGLRLARRAGAERALALGAGVGRDVLLLAVIAGLVGVHLAYWTPGQMYGPRYYFEAMGAIVLLSARGIIYLAHGARALLPRAWAPRAGLLVGALVVGLTAWAYVDFAPREFQRFVGWYEIDGNGVRAVAAAGLSDAVVFVEFDYWTDYAPFFVQNSPTLDTDVVYAVDLGEAQNRKVMSLYPGRSYYRYSGGRVELLLD